LTTYLAVNLKLHHMFKIDPNYEQAIADRSRIAEWGYVPSMEDVKGCEEPGVYILGKQSADIAKVGVATVLYERFKQIASAEPSLFVARFFFSDDPYSLEKKLHRSLAGYLIKGESCREWFAGHAVRSLSLSMTTATQLATNFKVVRKGKRTAPKDSLPPPLSGWTKIEDGIWRVVSAEGRRFDYYPEWRDPGPGYGHLQMKEDRSWTGQRRLDGYGILDRNALPTKSSILIGPCSFIEAEARMVKFAWNVNLCYKRDGREAPVMLS
jgi:hypothetical protein